MAAADPAHTFDYSDPKKRCDIVMKGGITSGVVYPLAVYELATAYRFKNIGGTSVGAIAAAAAAAAESGRRASADAPGFQDLKRLPDWLGRTNANGVSNLVSLFQPQPKTKPIFETLIEYIKHKKHKLAWLVLGAVPRFRWWWACIGTLPGLVVWAMLSVALWSFLGWVAAMPPVGVVVALFVVSIAFPSLLVHVVGPLRYVVGFLRGRHGVLRWIALVAGYSILLASIILLPFLLIPLGAVVGAAVGFGRRTLSQVPENDFGLCTGSEYPSERQGSQTGGRPDVLIEEPPAPLTTWLANLINQLAGRNDTDAPLTFGDLWQGREEPKPGTPEEERAINLKMMTTNLTRGRPYRLPFAAEEKFYFKPEDFERFFPKPVLDWLVAKGYEKLAELAAQGMPPPPDGLLPLPDAADFPVVVAARLSLSFPVLLSAVPLYTVEGQKSRKWWFSDGGITSNFPVHLFDAPLPRWPTFGINLHKLDPDLVHDLAHRDQCDCVSMWKEDGESIEEWHPCLRNLFHFFDAIKDTMQNWRDNVQIEVPGYRDRVAHIGFHKGEGGLNLYMPGKLIEQLSERGRCAGEKLIRRFTAPPDGPSWHSHRWVRYRSAMSVIEEMLEKLLVAQRHPWADEDEPTYEQLISRGWDEPPPYDRWQGAHKQFAENATTGLFSLGETWEAGEPWEEGPQRFADGGPSPQPELRIVPRA